MYYIRLQRGSRSYIVAPDRFSSRMKAKGKAHMCFPNRSLHRPEMAPQAVSAIPCLTFIIWGCKCVPSMCSLRVFLRAGTEVFVTGVRATYGRCCAGQREWVYFRQRLCLYAGATFPLDCPRPGVRLVRKSPLSRSMRSR